MSKVTTAVNATGKIIISVVLIAFFIICLVGMVLVWFSDWDIALKIVVFILALILGPGFTTMALVNAHFRNKR